MSRTAAAIYAKVFPPGLSVAVAPAELIVAVGQAEISRVPNNNFFYYGCVEDYFKTFVMIYDEHFSRQ